MKTLGEWLADHECAWTVIVGGAIMVFSHDPELWHLRDYAVSSSVSADGLVMVERNEWLAA